MIAAIEKASTIAISGHTNPDGDCVGSCLALCTYIRDLYPEKTVDVILEPISDKFRFLKYAPEIIHEDAAEAANLSEMTYDLYFAMDSSEPDRLGFARKYFDKAAYKICIDHHITNQGFGDLRFIRPDLSSACEVLYHLLDYDKISYDCAQALYLGLIHDTGVFKHSNTSRQTMEIAGALIDKGVRPDRIIDDTFYRKTYIQNQILGRALMESILMMDGMVIFSVISKKDMTFYGVDGSDLDGIIDQLRVTEGVECALLLYEKEDHVYKVSMRSNGRIDVSAIAQYFGGGGHVRAAGCTMEGEFRDIINSITALIEDQINQNE
ncbi:MAG: bifunctional oligoribonuclease/PAP phosphatase NrnA [Eubacterium sp.]|nr:bifunctional oligoribonuclease/PAP phosphatase NrnA [Eubacterium sp.]